MKSLGYGGPEVRRGGRMIGGADAVPPLGDGQGVALELALVAEGLSNQEIAERLVVSPWTAKTHVSRAMVKLGARDRAQLVAFAYESGLARPGWHRLAKGTAADSVLRLRKLPARSVRARTLVCSARALRTYRC